MIRLQERLGLHAQSRAEAEMALACRVQKPSGWRCNVPWCGTRRRLGEAVQRPVPAVKPSVMELFVPPLEEQERVERRSVRCSTRRRIRRSMWRTACSRPLRVAALGPQSSAPPPGAFFHPFQSGPADLYTREFRSRRAAIAGCAPVTAGRQRIQGGHLAHVSGEGRHHQSVHPVGKNEAADPHAGAGMWSTGAAPGTGV